MLDQDLCFKVNSVKQKIKKRTYKLLKYHNSIHYNLYRNL